MWGTPNSLPKPWTHEAIQDESMTEEVITPESEPQMTKPQTIPGTRRGPSCSLGFKLRVTMQRASGRMMDAGTVLGIDNRKE